MPTLNTCLLKIKLTFFIEKSKYYFGYTDKFAILNVTFYGVL